jgi:hypothetical protein
MVSPTKASFESMEVANTYDNYPDRMSDKLLTLRQLIFEVASEIGIEELEETLKWGEPSYLTKHGSTLRLAWRKSSPQQYGIFFNCKTSLVETFKEVYPDQFKYEANRAIVFEATDIIPVDALKHCIELSLTYHKIKQLPMLGI